MCDMCSGDGRGAGYGAECVSSDGEEAVYRAEEKSGTQKDSEGGEGAFAGGGRIGGYIGTSISARPRRKGARDSDLETRRGQ